jgi:hypothetical protein
VKVSSVLDNVEYDDETCDGNRKFIFPIMHSSKHTNTPPTIPSAIPITLIIITFPDFSLVFNSTPLN